MKKNILVVTFEREAMDQYSRQLSSMFGEEVEIYGYSVLEDIPCGLSEIDLIVVSCHDVTRISTNTLPIIFRSSILCVPLKKAGQRYWIICRPTVRCWLPIIQKSLPMKPSEP